MHLWSIAFVCFIILSLLFFAAESSIIFDLKGSFLPGLYKLWAPNENVRLAGTAMSIGTTVGIMCVLSALVYKYLTWYFDHWKKLGVRGPKPKIMMGNFEKSHTGKCNVVEVLDEIYTKYKSSERFVGIFMARTPELLVLDPALASQIMTVHFNNFRTNEARMWTTPKYDRLRSCSPMVSVGSSWSARRGEMSAALSMSKLRSLYPVMVKTANKLTDFIESHMDEVDIQEASMKYTAEFMSDVIWGIAADTFNEEKKNPIYELANHMILQADECVNFYRRTLNWPWLRKLRTERFFSQYTDDFLTKITKDATKLRLESQNNRMDVLNHLIHLNSKQGLTETRMIGHTATLLLNGFEMPGDTIAHVFLMLARNQNAQSKLRKEIQDNLDESGTLTFNRLHELPYLDQCIHETLRLFPSVSFFNKLCTAPIELENSDGTKLKVQPGDKVYFTNYSFHRDVEYFERAQEFIPERFDPEVGGIQKFRKLGVYLPFGNGPRMCLGMSLSLMEIKTAVSEVVRKFHMDVDPRTRTDNKVDPSGFILVLKGGIHLKFKSVT